MFAHHPSAIPWEVQPPLSVGIPLDHDLGRGLVFAFEGNNVVWDKASSLPLKALSSGVTQIQTPYGSAYSFSGSQADKAAGTSGVFNGLAGAAGASYDILVRFNSANPSTKFFAQWDSAGTDQRFLFQANAGTLVWVAGDKTGVGVLRSRIDFSSLFSSAGWYRLTAAFYGGSSYTMIVNRANVSGSVVTGDCLTFDAVSTDPVTVGGSGSLPLTGDVVLARVWRRGLSAQELHQLQAYPWALFEPIEIFGFTSAAIGIAANPLRGGGTAANPTWGYLA